MATNLRQGGSAPRCLGPLVPVSDQPGRRTLRSADINRLLVPPVKLSTVGSRAIPVAGPRVWNALPEEITSSSSQMMIFCRRLKAWLFRKSFPDIIIWLTLTLLTFLFCFANLEYLGYSDDDDDDDGSFYSGFFPTSPVNAMVNELLKLIDICQSCTNMAPLVDRLRRFELSIRRRPFSVML